VPFLEILTLITSQSKAVTRNSDEAELLQMLLLRALSAAKNGELYLSGEIKYVGFVVMENSVTKEIMLKGLDVAEMNTYIFSTMPTEGNA
jgi:hypothetical protein